MMSGFFWRIVICCWVVLASLAQVARAQDLIAVARIDPQTSAFEKTSTGADLSLSLSAQVPFRVFTLHSPDRLVLDFQDVDWSGINRASFEADGLVTDLRFGVFQPGWSRMVLDLAEPMSLQSAQMSTGGDPPELVVKLMSGEGDTLTSQSTNQNNRWTRETPKLALPEKTGIRIAIDPGHGGVDPGAVRDGVQEKDIALRFSLELAEMIRTRSPYDVVLSREADISVSLDERVRMAREAQADLFISVHANTVTLGDASGASVYTLSERASDRASAKLAELENRADLATGLNGHVEGDNVAKILVDLARVDTNARSMIFADQLIRDLDATVRILRSKPHRSAGFRVLKAHDIPSVLLELGFMSNERDRRNMQDRGWRNEAAIGVLNGIENWIADDKERSKLVLK